MIIYSTLERICNCIAAKRYPNNVRSFDMFTGSVYDDHWYHNFEQLNITKSPSNGCMDNCQYQQSYEKPNTCMNGQRNGKAKPGYIGSLDGTHILFHLKTT